MSDLDDPATGICLAHLLKASRRDMLRARDRGGVVARAVVDGDHLQGTVVLREQVTSPAGTTAAALRELEIHKVRAAFLAAMEAARDRSRALAEGS